MSRIRSVCLASLVALVAPAMSACGEPQTWASEVVEANDQRICVYGEQLGRACTTPSEFERFGFASVQVGDCFEVKFERESNGLLELASSDCPPP